MVSKFSQSIPRDMESLLILIYLGIPALAAGSSSVLPLVYRRFFMGGSLSSQSSSWFLGFSEVLGRTAQQLRAASLGFHIIYYVCFVS